MGLGLSGLRLGLGRRGGGGTPALPNFYVDSVGGSDANDGLTDATAFQTLAAAETAIGSFGAGAWASLALGSEWAEQLDLAVANAKLTTHGTGAIPYIDASGPVTETWYQPDSGTYPNVWAIDVSHSLGGQCRLPVWEDGVQLQRETSIALVNATAGRTYSPEDEALTSPSTVYVHATGSGNPNSNGKAYRIARRRYSITGAFSTYDNASVTGPLKVGNQSHNDGSIVLGLNSTVRQVLAVDGHKHNALQESGAAIDSIFKGAQVPSVGYLHVFYTGDAAGLGAEYTRCGFVGAFEDATYATGTQGFYCHDNAGGAHANMDITGCWSVGCFAVGGSASNTVSINGLYAKENYRLGSFGSSTQTINNLMLNLQTPVNVSEGQISVPGSTTASVTNTNSCFYIGSGIAFYRLWRIYQSSGTMALTNNTFVSDSDRMMALKDDGSSSVAVTFKHNVFRTFSPAGYWPIYVKSPSTITECDFNIYHVSNKSQTKFYYGSTEYTFAGWQALGFDQNSLLLDNTDIHTDDLFMNGLAGCAAGDFRLKTDTGLTFGDGSPITDAGAQTHYDYGARASAAGAPSAWPTVPITDAQCETYIADPEAWVFHP